MLGRADEAGDVEAGQGARPRVQVAQQNPKRFSVELDDGELLNNFAFIFGN
jgi:hypothetical protein